MAFYKRKMFGEDWTPGPFVTQDAQPSPFVMAPTSAAPAASTQAAGASWFDLAIAGLGFGTALTGAISGQPTTPAGTAYAPGVQPQYMAPKPAIATSTILLLGGAAVAVLFLMKK